MVLLRVPAALAEDLISVPKPQIKRLTAAWNSNPRRSYLFLALNEPALTSAHTETDNLTSFPQKNTLIYLNQKLLFLSFTFWKIYWDTSSVPSPTDPCKMCEVNESLGSSRSR